jgi:methyl-accepting chemotaxis protein
MPSKPTRVVLLLLPAIVLVPLCGVLAFLGISSWQARDARDAASRRLHDSALVVGRQLQQAVARQSALTEALGRSPAVHLWMQLAGSRPKQINTMHFAATQQEALNISRLLPGSSLLMTSEKNRVLYKDGAAVRRVSREEPQDSWYFAALKTGTTAVESGPRSIRTSARIVEGDRVLGAIACVSDVAALASAAIGEPGLAQQGMTVALTNSAGDVVSAAGSGSKGAATIFDLYPGSAHDVVAATLDALFRSDKVSYFTRTDGGRAVRTAAVRTPTPGWYLFLTEEFADRLPTARIIVVAGATAALLALLVLALLAIASARGRSTAILLARAAREREAAAAAWGDIGAAASEAQAAAARLLTLAGQLGRESAAGVQSGAEADALYARAEERETELRAGVSARGGVLNRLAAAAREAIEQSLRTQAAAAVAESAARAEEELTRVITAGVTTAQAVDKAGRAVSAISEAAQKLRLLSLNAALEAARTGAAGQGLSRIADEIRGLAEEAGTRARTLAESLAEAERSAKEVAAAAQEAGGSVHRGAAVSTELARTQHDTWEKVAGMLPQMDGANASAARLAPEIADADRGRSALQGITRIMGRIGMLASEMTEIAGRAAAQSARAAQTAASAARGTASP